MAKVLFLDDDKTRLDTFVKCTGADVVWCKDRAQFVDRLTNGDVYDLIMLDHDLGLPDFDGSDAAKWLSENLLTTGDGGTQLVVIHSANIVGASNMYHRMKSSDHLEVYVIAFAWMRCRTNPRTGDIQFGYPEEFED